jgi:hypothetical protein
MTRLTEAAAVDFACDDEVYGGGAWAVSSALPSRIEVRALSGEELSSSAAAMVGEAEAAVNALTLGDCDCCYCSASTA